MKTKRDIRSYSLEDLKGMQARGQTLGRNREAPRGPTLSKRFWQRARLVLPERRGKVAVNLRLDRDVFTWFKAQGPGHLSRMNAVLRSYYDAARADEETGRTGRTVRPSEPTHRRPRRRAPTGGATTGGSTG
jgi:uncharacterized protein (DUF4415 family)